jgi:hypothetical protein
MSRSLKDVLESDDDSDCPSLCISDVPQQTKDEYKKIYYEYPYQQTKDVYKKIYYEYPYLFQCADYVYDKFSNYTMYSNGLKELNEAYSGLVTNISKEHGIEIPPNINLMKDVKDYLKKTNDILYEEYNPYKDVSDNEIVELLKRQPELFSCMPFQERIIAILNKKL